MMKRAFIAPLVICGLLGFFSGNAPAGDQAAQEPVENPEGVEVAYDDFQKIDLDISLIGTAAGNPGRECAVIFDGKTKMQKMYSIGDRVHGYTITEITRDSVFFNADGQDYVLDFSRFGSVKRVASTQEYANSEGDEEPAFTGTMTSYDPQVSISRQKSETCQGDDCEERVIRKITFKSKQKVTP